MLTQTLQTQRVWLSPRSINPSAVLGYQPCKLCRLFNANVNIEATGESKETPSQCLLLHRPQHSSPFPHSLHPSQCALSRRPKAPVRILMTLCLSILPLSPPHQPLRSPGYINLQPPIPPYSPSSCCSSRRTRSLITPITPTGTRARDLATPWLPQQASLRFSFRGLGRVKHAFVPRFRALRRGRHGESGVMWGFWCCGAGGRGVGYRRVGLRGGAEGGRVPF